MAANAEEFLLKLNQQISGPASIAAGALNKLESQIRSEQGALAGLEGSLAAAKTKLAGLQEGFGGKVDISGVAKARAEIEKLQAKIDGGKANVNKLVDAQAGFRSKAAEAEAAAKAKSQAVSAAATEKAAKAEAAAEVKSASALQIAREKMAAADNMARNKAIASLIISQSKASAVGEKAAKGEAATAAKKTSDVKLNGEKAVKDAADSAKKITKETGLAKLGEAAKDADGPIGKLANGFEKLKAAGAAGVAVALVVALVAVATTAAAAAFALTRFALAAADAFRSSRLLANAASGVEGGGKGMTMVIDDIASKSPLARERIAEMARAMEVAKLRGRDMQNALEAATTATSAIGDAAGAAFTSIAEKSQFARRFLLTKADLAGTGVEFAEVAAALAQAMGTSVAAATTLIQQGGVSVAKGLEAMNAAVQKKFGKTVAAQMLSLTTQMAKLKENFGRLFDGVDIEPFLRGLKTITDLFSEQTVTGAALKVLFKSIFNPLAEASEGIFPIISAFLRGMVIATLYAYIALLKVKNAINEAFGGSSASKIDWVKVSMYAGMIAAIGIGAALFALAAIIALVIVVALPLAFVLSLPFIVPLALIGLLVYAIYSLYNAIASIQVPDLGIASAFSGALALLKSIDLGSVAAQIVASLVGGLTNGLPSVAGAMKGLGGAILSALPSALVMHSPSVLLTNQAKMAASSVVTPLEDAKDDAHQAMADLGGGRPDFSGATGGASKGKGEGRSITIQNINFTGTRDDLAAFKVMFADLIEQLSGESPEPTT